MLTRPIAAIRADRRLQAGVAALAIAGGAFAWWTISPLFLTTSLSETTREATAQVTTAPRAAAAPTAGATAAPTAAATGAPTALLLSRGELQRVDDVHHGMGPVLLLELEGKRFVRFDNVAIQNGPDLHVYLARGAGGAYDGSRDLYLGALKATNGTFTYDLPAGTRTADYRSVVVWCRAFSVLFTWADLKTS